MVNVAELVEQAARKSGIDYDRAIADANRRDGELRDAGMVGIHPYFTGFDVGETFDADGLLRDATGTARETCYTADDGTKVYFPVKRRCDVPNTALRDTDFARWCHDVRKVCFRRFTAYESARFSGLFDGGTDEDAVRACMSYAHDFPSLRTVGMGLLLHGACGVGKTHLAACICNEVIGQGYRPLMLNPNTLSDDGARKWGGFTPMLEELAGKNDLLVIDDLGRESTAGWMQGRVFEAIDYFYRNRIPLVVTTNYSATFLSKPSGEHSKPIIERLKERCNRVEVAGVNRRQMVTCGTR